MTWHRIFPPTVAAYLALLLLSFPAIAQQRSYRVVDVGTFGGPGSGFHIPETYNLVLNSRGTLVGTADTSQPAPPNVSENGFLGHAFQWRNGVLIDLGSLPNGINSEAAWVSESGLITGNSRLSVADPLIPGFLQFRAVLWKNGRIIDLGDLAGGHESFGHAVNSRGQVVGAAFSSILDNSSLFGEGFQTRAFRWQRGEMQDLGTLGGPDAVAVGINDSGQVIGESYTSSMPSEYCARNLEIPLATGGFIWQDGEMRDLGNFGGTCTLASGINNHGQVVGLSTLAGDVGQHAFLWDKGVLRDLGTFGGDISSALTLNEAGDVVGFAAHPGNEVFHGFLWSEGELKDLGSLNNDPISSAFDVNARGQVVGISIDADGNFRAVLWDGGQIIDLNRFLPAGSDLHLDLPATINDRGQIAVLGHLQTGESRALMLIPCNASEPDCQTIAAIESPSLKQIPSTLAKPKFDARKKLMEFVRARAGLRRFVKHTSESPIFTRITPEPSSTDEFQTNTSVQSTTTSAPTTSGTCSITSEDSVCVYEPSIGLTQNSPVHVRAATGSYFHYGYVYIDNILRSSTSANVDVYLPVTVGTHSLTVCARHYFFGRLSIPKCVGPRSFKVNSIGSCSAPSTAGVHVCSPLNSSTPLSPVPALATGRVMGTFARMELWVDGIKKLSSVNKTVDSRVTLSTGTHRFNFRAVNTTGSIWSKAVYATVTAPQAQSVTASPVDAPSLDYDSSVPTTQLGTTAATETTATTCSAPSSGVRICSPPSGATLPTSFHVSAAGSTDVTLMEGWMQGVLKFQISANHVETNVTGTPGSAYLVITGRNRGGVVGSTRVVLTLSSSGQCSANSLLICSPLPGTTVSSPVHVTATSNARTYAMDVFIDSIHRYGTLGKPVDVNLSATVGTHSLRVCAQQASNFQPFCKQFSFTVSGTSGCSAPSGAGVHVCSPSDGSTVASPVHALARGLVSGTFARMELWVDGVKKLNSTSTLIDTHLTLGTGTHRFNFRAVNTAGSIWSKVVSATIR